MNEIRIAILGDEAGVRNVQLALKYPQMIGATYIYDNDLFSSGPSDFLEEWDVIIVAFDATFYSDHIIPIIYGVIHPEKTLVLDFYQVRRFKVPFMNVDLVMNNAYHTAYDGLIFGISHSEWGIIADRLKPGNFAKLSVPSQDIYYNFKTLEYCCDKYFNKIAGLNTVIFDMYDYSYFNYDASMTDTIANYMGCGGFYKDPHNFEKNIDYPGWNYWGLAGEVKKLVLGDVEQEILDIWDMLFVDDMARLYDSKYCGTNDFRLRFDIVSDEQVDSFKIGSYTRERFMNTIEENKQYFERMLYKLYEINPEVKIYLVMMPRYEGVWEKEQSMVYSWKDFFYDTLNEMRERHSFEILDFIRDDIKKTRAYYQDATHFNFLGAMKFTDLLNERLKEHK